MTEDKFLDPQQQLFLEYYCSPKSKSFSNAYESAICAGYSDGYAKNILYTLPDWLADSVGKAKRLKKAEKLMDKIMDLEPVAEDGKVDNALIGNQVKIVTLIAKGIGKTDYSERTELTGKDGGSIGIEVENLTELSDEALARIIAESKGGESEERTSKEAP